jgi:pentatricopeptide repeat protein
VPFPWVNYGLSLPTAAAGAVSTHQQLRYEEGIGAFKRRKDHKLGLDDKFRKSTDPAQNTKYRPNFEFESKFVKLRNLPVTKDRELEMRAKYNTLLVECSKTGKWREAILIFEQLLHRDLKPDVSTLHRILISCKNAIPVQVEKALQVLTWWRQSHLLKSHSQKPTLSTFNLMISICEKARLWRKALLVFRMLLDGDSGNGLGLQPNTNTFDAIVRSFLLFSLSCLCYSLVLICSILACLVSFYLILSLSLIVRACSNGSVDEAPAIYESMKLCGIPELYCYTAANMKLQ